MKEGYYAHARPELVAQIDPGPGNVVLDVGCGEGALAASLKQSGRAGEIWGVELVTEAAERARASGVFDELLVGDLAQRVTELPRAHFTHVVAGDVLEHLVDPWTTLKALRGTMREGGKLVCSIPNIRNLSFLARLAFIGRFEYRDHGVMDRTHLRFFARRDARDLLAGAGFSRIDIGPARPKRSLAYRAARMFLGDLAIKSFLVTAYNPSKGPS
jgi:2-polyprenyl-3-methyl-5-hydroxy-6-metoxy-1,4-benzoquinol methylase